MQKKVLLAKDLNEQTLGLLSLENENNLVGRLKLFEEINGTLILKIGENILAFENANSSFEFKTIFHDLNLPLGAIIFNEKILMTAKTENFKQDFNSVYEEYQDIIKNQEVEDKSKNLNLENITNDNMKENEQEYADDIPQNLEEKDAVENFNEELLKLQNENNMQDANFELNESIFQNAKNEVQKLEKSVKNDVNFAKNHKNFEVNKSLAENLDEESNFFEQIKEQLDELFSKNKPFPELEEKIEGSKWTKVMQQGEFSNHYILGKIFDGDKLTHICYGVPAESENDLPDECLRPFSQWLPFAVDGVDGSGYWLMYQDAKTGENVLVN